MQNFGKVLKAFSGLDIVNCLVQVLGFDIWLLFDLLRRVPSDWSVPFDDAKIEQKELFRAEA